jgi:hypothetical protein
MMFFQDAALIILHFHLRKIELTLWWMVACGLQPYKSCALLPSLNASNSKSP